MLKKKYLKSKVKVTFEVPTQISEHAEEVYLVGDFNQWDERSTVMDKAAGNHFSITLELDPDREYQYRYLVNGKEWHNDWDADRYVPNPFSGDNSVVSTAALATNGANGHGNGSTNGSTNGKSAKSSEAKATKATKSTKSSKSTTSTKSTKAKK
ncbi:MAG: isoamylase early set domain-containing protein [Anaerolineae bacterium]|nr:isoamylase early set domain-containing protein [Anaerolineae bacterium]